MDDTIKWVIISSAFLLLIIFFVTRSFILKLKAKLKEQSLIIQRDDAERELLVNNLALARFDQFKERELEDHKKLIASAESLRADADFKMWVINYEQVIREDAKKRSTSILLGKITEHLIPYSSHFSHFNPKDARFIGSPIDLIYFDGAADNKDEITIYFVEVKTGTSGLSPVEKKIKSAVINKNVKWLESSLKDLSSTLEK